MDIKTAVQNESLVQTNLFENTVILSHDTLSCSPPDSLTPLLELLHSLTELAFIGGMVVGTIGFLFAGTCLMIPGEDWNRRGKSVASNTFIGMVLLLSANMIVGFLISQMGGAIC